jgi:hypothetical protein
MVDRLLEMASVFGALVIKDGPPSMELVQRDGVLLNDLNRHRLGSRKVPDLLALGLGFLEGTGNRSSIDVRFGFAQGEALGNDLTGWRSTRNG